MAICVLGLPLLVESLRSARLQRQIDCCFAPCQQEALLVQLFLRVVAIIVEVSENDWIVAEVLVVVFDDYACRLQHVPRVVDASP